MCLHFYLVLFEQVGYSIFLVQYRKVFSDQYNFFERVDLTFVLLYAYCVLRRMGGIFPHSWPPCWSYIFLQDMAVCVKTLYNLIMTTFLATMLALHFLTRRPSVCENASRPHHDYNSGHHVGLTFS